MTASALSARDGHVDNLQGLMICYVIVFHIYLSDNSSLWKLPLAFFMFWFFFKSGMFHKKRSLREVWSRGWRSLLVPYAVFSIVGYVVWMAKEVQMHRWTLESVWDTTLLPWLTDGTLPGNVALWFLPSLLVVKLLASCCCRNRTSCALVCIVSFSFAGAIHYLGFTPPELYIVNIPLGLGSYAFGYLVREIQWRRAVFVIACLGYVGIMVLSPSIISVRENHLDCGSWILALVCSLCGCMVFTFFCKILPERIPLLGSIGQKSMDYYVTHMIVLQASLFAPVVLVPYLKELQLLACIILLPLFSLSMERFGWEWMLGRK